MPLHKNLDWKFGVPRDPGGVDPPGSFDFEVPELYGGARAC